MTKSSTIPALNFGMGYLSGRTSGIHGTYVLLTATYAYNVLSRMKLSKPAACGFAYSSKKCPEIGGISYNVRF